MPGDAAQQQEAAGEPRLEWRLAADLGVRRTSRRATNQEGLMVDGEEDPRLDRRRCVRGPLRSCRSVWPTHFHLVRRSHPRRRNVALLGSGTTPTRQRIFRDARSSAPGDPRAVLEVPTSYLRLRLPGIFRQPAGLAGLAHPRRVGGADTDRVLAREARGSSAG